MTFFADDKVLEYSPHQIPRMLASLGKMQFEPKFVTLHNTAVPTLKQWQDGKYGERQRILGQKHYEALVKGWHSGPHWFVSPTGCWNLCDMTQDGVSVSCWNDRTIGIEMVGDFETEAFDIGLGSKVRNNAVALMAAIHNHFGWHPDPLITGVCGLHFHAMCARDHHPCPGKNVQREDVVARVFAEMKLQSALS